MRAITLHAPFATLLVTRQACDCRAAEVGCHHSTCASFRPVKRFETRSWPCPPSIIGQRAAFHQAHADHGCGDRFGDYVLDWTMTSGFFLRRDGQIAAAPLPLGAIVGSGVITASYRIYDRDSASGASAYGPRIVSVPGYRGSRDCLWLVGAGDRNVDISDQLPYGDWTPGRHAWLIEDAAPTTERCPWCWGTGKSWGSCDACLDRRTKLVDAGPGRPQRRVPCPDCCTPDGEALPCPACKDVGRCGPIPATGRQGFFEWSPT